MSGKQRIYWDANVFIAWITDEKRPNREMDGVYDIANLTTQNKIILMTTELIDLEVEKARIPKEARPVFKSLFSRKNVVLVPRSPRVWDLTNEIVDFYLAEFEKGNGKPVTHFDALHLASAIHYNADAVHTFDDGKRKKGRSLLSLNGDVAGHDLKICKPPVGQMRLGLESEDEIS